MTIGSPPTPSRLVPDAPRQAGVDHFDDTIVAARPRAWIGLGACVLLLVGLVVWATTARVDVTMKLPAVALRGGAVFQLHSPVDGYLTDLPVAPEAMVRKGQTVAVVTDAAGKTHPIAATVAGQVLSVPWQIGNAVHRDEAVATIGGTTGKIVIRAFPSMDAMASMNVGMTALVGVQGAPVPPVPATVTDGDMMPLTREQAISSIGDQAIGETVVKAPTVLSIIIEPDSGKVLPDGSIDFGNGAVLSGDALADVTLILGSRHPIDYVF